MVVHYVLHKIHQLSEEINEFFSEENFQLSKSRSNYDESISKYLRYKINNSNNFYQKMKSMDLIKSLDVDIFTFESLINIQEPLSDLWFHRLNTGVFSIDS